MAITPDTKNWTWVLERACPQCGFDAVAFDVAQTGAAIRDVGGRFASLLDEIDEAEARRRPNDETWSLLEYGCHVRDVLRLGELRLHLMLDRDDPLFANWDQDATAIDERYGEQDPRVVAGEIASAATTFAAAYDAVTAEQWQRAGVRSDGARFTVDSFARYFLHDPIHHLYDVGAPR
ncbi:MAG: DinB family protein [Acidimicrobiia bacterium]